jgi:cholesterol transport system auxiliary component
MSRQKYGIILCVICSSVIAGCQLPGPVATQEVQRYLLRLEQTATHEKPATASCSVLRISRPVPGPGLATRRMLYRQTESQLDYFAYHEWADTPSEMFATLLYEQLHNTGWFRAVVSGSIDVPADFRLDSKLARLEQGFDATGSWIQFDIAVTIVEVSNRSILFSDLFSYRDVATSPDPTAGAAAIRRALHRFIDDLSSRLVQLDLSKGCDR